MIVDTAIDKDKLENLWSKQDNCSGMISSWGLNTKW